MSPPESSSLVSDTPAGCRNCGAPLTGPYCAHCGQARRERIVPFRRFVTDYLREFFSFDARFFKSLGWLLRRPGYLTNEYVAGRRARYMAPVRLYLIISFLFFLLVTLVRTDLSGFTLLDPLPADTVAVSPAASGVALDSTAARQGQAGEETAATDTTAAASYADSSLSRQLGYRLGRRLGRASRKVSENQNAFESSLLNRIPLMMFFLLPVFALLVKLLYLRRSMLYAQHFIFALHVHAFAFLLLLALFMLDALGVPMQLSRTRGSGSINLIGGGFLVVFLTYVFLAMRRVYEQSRTKTLLKLVFLAITYQLVFSLAFGIVALVSLLLF